MLIFLRGRHFLERLVFLMLVVFAGPNLARADFEEVRIVRVEPVQVQTCAPATRTAKPQPQPGSGITSREVLGGVAGAAVGGVIGNQVGSGSGKTAATVAGAGLGAYAGYKLAEAKPQQAAQQVPGQTPAVAPQQAPAACSLVTQHRIEYARSNGLQGEVMMSSEPTGSSLLMTFCGDSPCN